MAGADLVGADLTSIPNGGIDLASMDLAGDDLARGPVDPASHWSVTVGMFLVPPQLPGGSCVDGSGGPCGPPSPFASCQLASNGVELGRSTVAMSMSSGTWNSLICPDVVASDLIAGNVLIRVYQTNSPITGMAKYAGAAAKLTATQFDGTSRQSLAYYGTATGGWVDIITAKK
jgi:hypothetical protein